MKCGSCGQDILQAHPEMCPYCHSKNLISEETASHEAEQLEKAGKYEEAALTYEKLDLWDEAKRCRLQAKKKHLGPAKPKVAGIETVTLKCPNCGTPQPFDSKSSEGTCKRCGTSYRVPEKVLEMHLFEADTKER
jgi:DNA-directed RNA polymerase subunit RPC12/RpoP